MGLASDRAWVCGWLCGCTCFAGRSTDQTDQRLSWRRHHWGREACQARRTLGSRLQPGASFPRPLGARPSERPGAAHRQESPRPFRSVRPRPLRAAQSSHGRGPAAAAARPTPAPDSQEPSPRAPDAGGRDRHSPGMWAPLAQAQAHARPPKYRETGRAARDRVRARAAWTRPLRELRVRPRREDG